MFYKNDKSLLTARIILIVVISIMTAGCVLSGIILAVLLDAIYLLIAAGGGLFCWLGWVVARLYLSYLCDVKLIRNKLYGIDNDSLQAFLSARQPEAGTGYASAPSAPAYTQANSAAIPPASPAPAATSADKTEELLHLKKLLDMGAISQEEFDAQKARILRG